MGVEHRDPFVQDRLFSDYVSNFQALRDFYAWNPYDPDDLKRALDRLGERSYSRRKLANILERQNKAFGCGEKTSANIELLRESGTFAVITGQQAGLFTGSLLTVYKTLNAIQLSEQLNQKHENKFVPVFWVVSDDHDFEEVNHLFLVSSENEVVRLSYQSNGEFHRCPVGNIPVDENFVTFLELFTDSTPNTEFKEEVLKLVGDSYIGACSFADGFCRLMTTLFREYGLVLVDPLDPELAELAVPIFEKEIVNPSKSTDLALQAGEQLVGRGYHQQVTLRPGRLNVFFEIEGRRCSVSLNGDTFSAEGKTYTTDELLTILNSSPDRFSPNVVLRPVVRSHLLPAAVYVGGPGEISYFAQLRQVFETFNVLEPVVCPRLRITLVERKVRNILDKYSISPVDVFKDADGVVRSIVERNLPKAFKNVFQEMERDVEKLFERIREVVVPVDSSLGDLLTRSQNRLAHDIGKIEKKAIQARKKSEGTVVRQIRKVKVSLFPNGFLQERILNIVPFLILYGPDFLKRLNEAIDLNTKQHQMIDI